MARVNKAKSEHARMTLLGLRMRLEARIMERSKDVTVYGRGNAMLACRYSRATAGSRLNCALRASMVFKIS
jgi:hypothetical protein